MSDRVAVMSQGNVEQVGALATRSTTTRRRPFVASFVGENNLFPGTGWRRCKTVRRRIDTPFGPLAGSNPHRLAVGEEALLFVRPERMRLRPPARRGRQRSTSP